MLILLEFQNAFQNKINNIFLKILIKNSVQFSFQNSRIAILKKEKEGEN